MSPALETPEPAALQHAACSHATCRGPKFASVKLSLCALITLLFGSLMCEKDQALKWIISTELAFIWSRQWLAWFKSLEAKYSAKVEIYDQNYNF